MPSSKRWLSIALVALVSIGLGTAAVADSGTESQFLSLINSTRSANGLGPLTMEGKLRAHARKHTADMIAAGDIYHSSSAELSAAGGSGWSKIGENVGRGQNPNTLHQAFMASSGHKANILGDYNYVGIGTEQAGDRLYVTVVFMKKGETAPPTTQAPPPTEAPAPEPPADEPPAPAGGSAPTKSTAPTTTVSATTTTTVPTTTTTTLDVPPDRPVTPGLSCLEATRYWNLCHD